MRKRGDDFWGEFEFYLSDLVVGCVLDCVLVGLLAPAAVIGAKPKSKPSGKHHAKFPACWVSKVEPAAMSLAATPPAMRHASLHRALPECMWQVSISKQATCPCRYICMYEHGSPRDFKNECGPGDTLRELVDVVQRMVTIPPVVMLLGSSQTVAFFPTAAYFSDAIAPMP